MFASVHSYKPLENSASHKKKEQRSLWGLRAESRIQSVLLVEQLPMSIATAWTRLWVLSLLWLQMLRPVELQLQLLVACELSLAPLSQARATANRSFSDASRSVERERARVRQEGQ